MGGDRARSRRVVAAATAAALACALAPAGPAVASPLELFGFGGRSPGLAATGVASSTDYDSVYLNPAGLGEVSRKRLTVGYLFGTFSLAMDGIDTGTEGAQGLLVGGALPIPFGGALRGRVGLGLGFYIPSNVINRARAPQVGEPTFALLESRSHVVAIQVAGGVRLGGGWRFGAGIIALAALRGFIDVSTDAAGRFTSLSEQQLITQFAPVAGVKKTLGGRWAFGATVRGESRSDYDILVTNDLGETLPVTLPELRVAGVAQYDPMAAVGEIAWRVRPPLLLSAQLAYQHWAAYPLPVQNPVADRPAPESPGFHDTVVPRVAAEWSLGDGHTSLDLRGGYAFVPSPAPEMRAQQSLLDNHRHVVALGVGASWPDFAVPLHIDAWAQVHQLMPRTHTKDPAEFGPDEPMPFQAIETSGRILVGGLTVGIDL